MMRIARLWLWALGQPVCATAPVFAIVVFLSASTMCQFPLALADTGSGQSVSTTTPGSFTPIEYILGGLVGMLAGIVMKMALYIRDMKDAHATKIETLQEERRKAEIDTYKTVTPLADNLVEVLDRLAPVLHAMGSGGAAGK